MNSYLKLKNSGKLYKIKEKLISALENCQICPRSCKVNRLKEKKGFCKTGRYGVVSSSHLHYGEEPPLVGRGGSGTIFFSWCNLGCIYCQNYTISHYGEGSGVSPKELAQKMIYLQNKGAHNINFVTPTHVIPQIIEALDIAIDEGLNIPLVYNSGGYDKVETLKLLDGIFDIYMPDAKYSDESVSKKYSKAEDYWQVCQKALLEMQRQVGDLKLNSDGIAQTGMIIRHLILPNNLAGSYKVLDFIAKNVSCNAYVNIMDQYYPCYKASNHSEINRRISKNEYEKVVKFAKSLGLKRGF